MTATATALALALWVTPAAVLRAQEVPEFPEGVTRISLPHGEVRLENIASKNGPLVKLSVGQTSVEGRRLFFGDGRVAMEVEATKEGMHFPSSTGRKGFVIDGSMTHAPGANIDLGTDYLTPGELKAGSVYVATPSVKFHYKAKPRP